MNMQSDDAYDKILYIVLELKIHQKKIIHLMMIHQKKIKCKNFYMTNTK